MSRINEKMGFKPAGQRSMMKLPKNLAERNRITSAQCPECQRRGARPSKTKGAGWAYCPHCNAIWELPAAAEPA
jgi:ribosomal protein L37AE/L43A